VRLRRGRAIAVGCFCGLILLVGAERRLADAHLNRLSSSPAFENDDLLDGDEIRIRLTLLASEGLPPVLPTAQLAWQPARATDAEAPPPAPLSWSSSRAPPAPRRVP
jgi:hypothetical protein